MDPKRIQNIITLEQHLQQLIIMMKPLQLYRDAGRNDQYSETRLRHTKKTTGYKETISQNNQYVAGTNRETFNYIA